MKKCRDQSILQSAKECPMSNRSSTFVALMILAIGAALSLAACETQSQMVAQREDNLAAAGFIVKPANTPERQQMLHRLPPHTFVQRVNGDAVHYVFADPLVCGCLYVGTQQAYNAYKLHEQQKNLADEQAMTAQSYADPAWNWGAWGPWGPGPGVPYGFVYGPPYGW
jgi:hypothetical protein